MTLNPSNSSDFEHLALKGLRSAVQVKVTGAKTSVTCLCVLPLTERPQGDLVLDTMLLFLSGTETLVTFESFG